MLNIFRQLLIFRQSHAEYLQATPAYQVVPY